MSRAPIKVSHSIAINPPPPGLTTKPPIGTGNTAAARPPTQRGRSSSPMRLSKPLSASTPQSNRTSMGSWSARSYGKSTPRAPSPSTESEITAFNLTPMEIIQVAKLIEQASCVKGKNPKESLKAMIRKVRTQEDNIGISDLDQDLFTSFLPYPSFSTAGFGSIVQPALDSTFDATVGNMNESEDRVPKIPHNKNAALLEDSDKPDDIAQMERLAKARKELRQQRLERMRLKHIAERNEILSPNLVSSVHKGIEAMADSLDKFYESPVFQTMKSNEPVEQSIPCPIAKRKEMIQIFENLEKISSTQFSTDQKIDATKLEEYIQHLITKTNSKTNSVEKSITDLKSSNKRTAELLDQLELVKKL